MDDNGWKAERVFHAVKRIVVAAVVAGVTASLLTAVPASAQEYGNSVDAGRRLVAGDTMSNSTGYTLTVQTDGNVVERRGATAVWATRTEGNPGAVFDVQTDGNLVVRSSSGRALWNSGSAGRPAGQMVLNDTGELQVFAASGEPIWSNGIGVTVRRSVLGPGQFLRSDAADHDLFSPSGRISFGPTGGGVAASESAFTYGVSLWYRGDRQGRGQDVPGVLTMQTDGNLVLRGTNGVAYWWTGSSGAGNRLVIQDDGNFVVRRSNGSAAWSSGTTRILLAAGETATTGRRFLWSYTYFDPVYVTTVQPDGNVVARGPDNRAIWTTNTAGNPGARLIMQTDGNLVVRRPDGRAVWQSGTSRCGPDGVFNVAFGTIYNRGEEVWTASGGSQGVC